MNVATHIAVTESDNLLKKFLDALAKENLAAPDKSGRTPLVAVAEDLRGLSPVEPKKQMYSWVAAEIIRSIDRHPASSLRSLLNFIAIGNLPLDNIVTALKGALRTSLPPARATEHRAMILSWLTKVGRFVEPHFLQKERRVRENFPWHWIDAMSDVDWEAASECIEEQLKSVHDVQPLLARLPYFWERHGQDKCVSALRAWLGAAEAPAREALIRWATRRKIELDSDDSDDPDKRAFFNTVGWTINEPEPAYA